MLVSFIIVAYNAGEKIINILSDITKQDYNHGEIEVILVDSKSSDNTKEFMEDFAQSSHNFSRVCVLNNPKKILPCGWNLALNESKGDVILRVDAHSSIPENFISKNIESIKAGEKIVGGHRISVIDENNSWQRTLLVAEKSLFGSGIASYRRTEEKKYVSTLAHAAYSRDVFQVVGGYDERLARTEDNEIHYRMKKAGFNFFLDPEIKSLHHARNSFGKMLKQKYLNGYWIGLTMSISPNCFSLYHFIPFVFVFAIIIGIVLGVLGLNGPLLFLIGVYSLFSIVNTILAIVGKPFNMKLILLPFLFFLLHFYYGLGTLLGLLYSPFWKKKSINKDCKNIDYIRSIMSNQKDQYKVGI